ncbi:MAG: tetratricopeptide repeat protein [Myxococcota bacterium]
MSKRKPGAYQRALQLMEGGEVAEAASVLQAAVAERPGDWTLWQLLGNARDELEAPERALDAYARALACPDVWEAPVHQNRAVVLERLDRHDQALSEAERALADPDREPFEAEALNVAVTCLVELGRPDDAVELARAMLDRCEGNAPKARLAALHAELAWALWLAHDDRDAALAELRAAGRLAPQNPRIHELLAELGGHRPSWLPGT